ncbi:MAG: right-handed parallel beta-helix repeat-containing protein [Anaerolineae bacterium]
MVNDAGDAADADTADGVCDTDLALAGLQCTLRAAIQEANAQPGLDTINFDLPPDSLTIQPATALPEISETVIVDASTGPGPERSEAAGAEGDAQPEVVCVTPTVQIDGALTGGSTDGLAISGGGSTVRGLIITRFPDAGILLIGGAGNAITCNLIGVDAAGTAGLGNGGNGIDIFQSDGNTIGGSEATEGNIIAGNGLNGVKITLADDNTVLGNTIGVDPTGSAALPNGGSGVAVVNSIDTTIGGAAVSAGNLISGNGAAGIYLGSGDGSVSSPSLVQGNLIGVDAVGLSALPNQIGIDISDSTGNMIGGSTAGARNLISGNTQAGIRVVDGSDNTIHGNWIGVDATGVAALPNNTGILITTYSQYGSGSFEVGGGAAGEANVVSGNSAPGINVTGRVGGSVSGNLIGVGADGVTALGNGSHGITASDSSTGIGGAGAGNVIAANGGYGIAIDGFLYDAPWSHAYVFGNAIGAAADGSPLHPNALGGIRLDDLPGQVEDNVIVGNGGAAITVLGSDADVQLRRNATADNAGLGIDLAGDGVTPNDPGDGDGGPNQGLNFPTVLAATAFGSATQIDVTFDGLANVSVAVELFSSPTCDPSGYGEGTTYLDEFYLNTDGSGTAAGTATITQSVPVGHFVTATATYYAGSTNFVTSEFSACAVVQPSPCTSGPHSGTITADEIWCAIDSPHQMTGDVIVAPNATLTVEPGVMVKGATTVELQVQGHLAAIGTPTQPITFTSAADTAYNQWSGLVFDGGTGELDYATVRYGGRPNSINPTCGSSGLGFNVAARNVQAGELRIRNSQIRSVGYQCNFHSPDYGLYIDNSRVIVENTTFANNGISNTGDYAIYVAGAASSLDLTGNTFTANKNNRVLVASGAMTAASFTLVAEEGLESYELMGDFTVPLGITLAVEPGVMVMARDTSVELNVQGHLQAIGLPTQPITFTSATNTGSNQWAGIVFDGTAGGGTGELDYATVRYGGRPNSLNATCGTGGMGFNVGVRNVLAGEVRIRHSQIRSAAFNCNFDSHDYGLYIDNSRVTVENTLFANNGNSNTTNPNSGDFAVYASGASTVLTFDGNVVRNNRRGLQLNGVGAQTLRNNVFKDNPLGGVYIAAGAQAQLLHTTFTGNSGDAVTVASGGTATLTNSIIANNTAGVRVNSGGAGTLERTLWYDNGANTVGTVSQTGSMTGEPLFAADGYHLTHLSPALEQGVNAGVAVDIDGEARPQPAGTGPDLGVDEYDAAQELIFAKIALPPVWEVTGAIPAGSLTQRYLLPFRYGSPDQNAAPLDVTVTDALPAALSLVSQTHWPPMSFSQNGQTLTWQTQAPLARSQSGMIDITTIYANPQPGQVLINTAALNSLAAQAVTTVPFFAPYLVTPGSGEICPGDVEIRGLAQPGVTVHLFIDGAPLAQIAVNGAGEFSTTYPYDGSTIKTLTAQACTPGGACSAVSSPITLRPPLSFWCPQRSQWEGTPAVGPKAGQHLVFGFRNNTGEFSSQNWQIPGVYGFWNTTLTLRACNCPPASGTTAPPSSVWIIADGVRYDPTGSHPDYTFAVTGAAHNVVFWADCGGNFVSSTGIILIDPDGYVFDVTQGFDPNDPTAHAIPGVTVTLFELTPEWGGWTPWPAHLYNNQVNPQVTGSDGYFAFFTPPGQYYLQVEGKPGYQPWRSPVITVVNEIVHVNVPYTPWTEPPAAETATEILLTANGPQPASLTVPAGTTVQWRAEVNGLLPPVELVALAENPTLHPLSALNPISSTRGWDGGMLQPGQIYQRQMNQPGRYTYSDGLGNEAEICVDTCAPLAVTLAAFEATAYPDAVQVVWETASELDNTGFNLYRSISEEWNSAVLLATVPSQAPGSAQGFVYRYDDAMVQPGQTVWYWLEDVDLSGVTTLHGPVHATVAAPTAVQVSSFSAQSPSAPLPALAGAALAAALLAGVLLRRRQAALH